MLNPRKAKPRLIWVILVFSSINSTLTFSLSPIDTPSFHPLSHLCRHLQCRQEIQLGTILLTLLLFSLHFAVTIEFFAIFVKHFSSFSVLEQTSPAPDAILIFNDIVLYFRACLKSTFCRVRTAHQPLKAPEGRKVYRNAKVPCTKAPAGRQVRRRQI